MPLATSFTSDYGLQGGHYCLGALHNALVGGDQALEAKLKLDEWAYTPGLPDNAVRVRSMALASIDATLARVAAGAPIRSIDASRWSTQEWVRFLFGLPRPQTAARLKELDLTLGLSNSPNPYVQCAWLALAAANRYDPAVPAIERFLLAVGRALLIMPIYPALASDREWGLPIAR